MPGLQGREEKYSSITGVIFLFNLIVGTGALALPGALQRAGYILGIVLLIMLALFSFITVTFVIESLAAANALSRKRYGGENVLNQETRGLVEATPLMPHQEHQENNIFEITEKFEIGQMGVLLSPKWCQIVVYLCICVYLFGDTAIYGVVIGRCGSQVLCSYKGNYTNSTKLPDNIPCWENNSITRVNVYRLIVFAFILLLGPFVFFNLQKTKFLQITTTVMRWLSFFIMIIWSTYKLVTVGAQGHPPAAEFKSLPTLFGTLVYSFMCQHSIPGLIQPIRNKKKLVAIIGTDFVVVTIFYTALSMTAIFTFLNVQDIYTLNFWDESTKSSNFNFLKFLAIFLALFPIFTISANFPIIAITLRNNLRNMILRDTPNTWYLDRLLFPLIAILPGGILAVAVPDIHFLVGIVGSYAGACIQYLIPCLLVFFARAQTKDFNLLNIHASPFKSKIWIYIVHGWMIISLIFITVDYCLTIKKPH